MSWVFLTDGYAYTLKNPVCHDLFNFRAVEARRHYCEDELRLNRRVADRIVALASDAQGHLQLGQNGAVIDWLIKMRCLPTRHMRDYAISKGTVSAEDIRRVAARLTAFYRNGIEIALDPAAYRGRFLHDIERNRRKLSRPKYRLPVERVHGMSRAQRAALARLKKRFAERVRPGKIVEGHGDLRPEHICIAPEVAMIDCLGFTRDLRIVDSADELGFRAEVRVAWRRRVCGS